MHTAATPRAQRSAQLVARVHTLIRYRALADFCYHSVATAGVPPPLHANRASRRTAANAILRALLTQRQCSQPPHALVERLRPRRLARAAREYGRFDYAFRQYSLGDASLPTRTELIPNRPLGDDRRSDVNRIALLHHRVAADALSVPQQPQCERGAPAVRSRRDYERCLQLVRQLFRVRPVWVRRALQEGMEPRLARQFKRVIPQVAYTFQGTGPFYQAWIRYGFDPRKHASCRQWQTVEIRVTNALIIAARAQLEQQRERDALQAHGSRGKRDDEAVVSCASSRVIGSGDGGAHGTNAPTNNGDECGDYSCEDNNQLEAVADELLGRRRREVGDGGQTGGEQHATPTRAMHHHATPSHTRAGAQHTRGREFGAHFEMPSSFTLSQLPRKRNNFVQVCDITLAPVVRYCEQLDVAQTFDKRFGFFSQQQHERLLQIIKDTLVQLSKQRLGEERVRQIMRGDYSSVAHLMVNRRRKLFLKDVIRPRKRARSGGGGGGGGSSSVARVGAAREEAACEEAACEEAAREEAAGGETAGEDELADVDGFALLEDDENDEEDDEDDEEHDAEHDEEAHAARTH
eukprot:TRINITY_DN1727_c0_g1_i10.p1 TRINITY_DN1727_c0_g1~~TRINITY_DN1727_c0_g1_i10.p1  ORF type:complete len:578 (-),score=173.94 TRINITY_DN1727_c0_g1_i10:1253-2986(-)